MITLYRLALGMLPAAVREQYGEQMSVVFADLVHDVRRRRGRYAACRVIVAELGALVFFAWRERRGQKPPPRIDERCFVWQLENEGGRPMFASFLQDLRYAARMLRRTPGFTFVCIATMAVAIGATTAIFSVVNGILIKPLPFPESDRLIALVHQAPGVNQSEMAASPAIYFTYREK